jgi:hypothetical protein
VRNFWNPLLFLICCSALIFPHASKAQSASSDRPFHMNGLPHPSASELEDGLIKNHGSWTSMRERSEMAASACHWKRRLTFSSDHTVRVDTCPSDIGDLQEAPLWHTHEQDGDTWLDIGHTSFQVIFVPAHGQYNMQLRDISGSKIQTSLTTEYTFTTNSDGRQNQE